MLAMKPSARRAPQTRRKPAVLGRLALRAARSYSCTQTLCKPELRWEARRVSPGASLSLSPATHLNVLNNSYDRVYL
jgi:hypothetical protein